MGTTNYSVMNTNNIYNFLIVTLESLNDEQKKKFAENMKLQIGLSFYEDFKIYLFKKLSGSELLNYFKN